MITAVRALWERVMGTRPAPGTDAWIARAGSAVLEDYLLASPNGEIWLERAERLVRGARRLSPTLVRELTALPPEAVGDWDRTCEMLESLSRARGLDARGAAALAAWAERGIRDRPEEEGYFGLGAYWRALVTLLRRGLLPERPGVMDIARRASTGSWAEIQATRYLYAHHETPITMLRSLMEAQDPRQMERAGLAAEALTVRGAGEECRRAFDFLVRHDPAYALEVLGYMPASTLARIPADAVLPLLADPDPEVRSGALVLLPQIGGATTSAPARPR